MEERDTAITKESNYGETERDKMFTTVLRIKHWWCCHVWFESSEKSEDEFCWQFTTCYEQDGIGLIRIYLYMWHLSQFNILFAFDILDFYKQFLIFIH